MTSNVSGDRAEAILYGHPFDLLTLEQALSQCLDWCRQPVEGTRTVITVNAAMLVAMRKNTQLDWACRAGDLIVADGVPVVWSSRLLRAPLPGRVNGTDLMERLLDLGARNGLRVYFLGAREQVVATLAEQSARKYPRLTVAGYRNGYFTGHDYSSVIEAVRRSRADVLFVGMPTPFKEVWCTEHRDAFGVHLIIGVGGSFDVLAGFIPRAPRWMQKNGLEWAWRLIKEPTKMWKRYLVTNSIFILMVLREVLKRRANIRDRDDSARGRAFTRMQGMPKGCTS